MAILAAILYPPGTEIDGLLVEVARKIAEAGGRVGGVVQGRGADGKGLALTDLGSGAIRSISQNLGPLSTSCKLDTSVMADVTGHLERQIDAGLDLMILSRFGSREIEGGGFRSLFGRAMLAGIPLLTGVRVEHAAAVVCPLRQVGRWRSRREVARRQVHLELARADAGGPTAVGIDLHL